DPTGFLLEVIYGGTHPSASTWLQIGTTLASIGLCAAAPVAGCIATVLDFAAINAVVAINDGAPPGQVILGTAIGVGVGFATGGIVRGNSLWVAMVNGAMSSYYTSLVNAVVFQKSLGWNVLESMAEGAAYGAISYGARRAFGVSRASAAAAQTG